jgi:hypothetical protein
MSEGAHKLSTTWRSRRWSTDANTHPPETGVGRRGSNRGPRRLDGSEQRCGASLYAPLGAPTLRPPEGQYARALCHERDTWLAVHGQEAGLPFHRFARPVCLRCADE